VYQSRLGISLYDAQYVGGQKVPIPSDTISKIVAELRRFKQVTLDFDVPQHPRHVRVLATEATRNASNSADFISNIERALGEPWKVDILAKEDEGRIGALGVVSSVGGSSGLQGLMMDLGGKLMIEATLLRSCIGAGSNDMSCRWLDTTYMAYGSTWRGTTVKSARQYILSVWRSGHDTSAVRDY